jgi:hypothetical protein
VSKYVTIPVFVVILQVCFIRLAAANGAAGWDSGNSVSVGASTPPGPGGWGGDNQGGTSSSSPSILGSDSIRGSSDEGKPSPQCVLGPLDAATSANFPAGGPTPGQWYLMYCNGKAFLPSTGLFWIPYSNAPKQATAAPVDPLALAEEAYKTIVLPPPSIHTNPSPNTFVNLPTWLWIDPGGWHPLEATASAGAVTATAVATPSSVTWSMGDGSTVVCPGPGTPYDPDEPSQSQSTDCSYTYTQSSADQPSSDGNPDDGAYQVSATITWSVTWTATGAPGGGVLPTLQTTSSVPLRVEQIESVGTAS